MLPYQPNCDELPAPLARPPEPAADPGSVDFFETRSDFPATFTDEVDFFFDAILVAFGVGEGFDFFGVAVGFALGFGVALGTGDGLASGSSLFVACKAGCSSGSSAAGGSSSTGAGELVLKCSSAGESCGVKPLSIQTTSLPSGFRALALQRAIPIKRTTCSRPTIARLRQKVLLRGIA